MFLKKVKQQPGRVYSSLEVHVVPVLPVHGEAGHHAGQLRGQQLVVTRLADRDMSCLIMS